MPSGLAPRPGFCLRAWRRNLAWRHARTHDSLKPSLALGLLNNALRTKLGQSLIETAFDFLCPQNKDSATLINFLKKTWVRFSNNNCLIKSKK